MGVLHGMTMFPLTQLLIDFYMLNIHKQLTYHITRF